MESTIKNLLKISLFLLLGFHASAQAWKPAMELQEKRVGINLPNLAVGTYMAEITTERTLYIKKLVIVE